MADHPLSLPDPNIQSVVAAYLRHAKRELMPSTFSRWSPDLEDFARVAGEHQVENCPPYVLTDWVDDHPGWKSPATRATAITAVKTCFQWAEDEGRIRHNPFRRVKVPRATPRRKLTDAEFDLLVQAVTGDKLFVWVLRFMWFTGARTHEIASLVWSEIDFELRIAVQINHKTRHTQAKPTPRVIPLEDDRAMAVLNEIRGAGFSGEHVFFNRFGRPWKRHALAARLRRLRKRLGIPKDAKLYGARHSAAQHWFDIGLDLKRVSELLGHSSTAITEKWYLEKTPIHLLQASLRKALDADKSKRTA